MQYTINKVLHDDGKKTITLTINFQGEAPKGTLVTEVEKHSNGLEAYTYREITSFPINLVELKELLNAELQ